jgi:hypothetical protein
MKVQKKTSLLEIYRQLNMNKNGIIRVPCNSGTLLKVWCIRERNSERTKRVRYGQTIFGLTYRKANKSAL